MPLTSHEVGRVLDSDVLHAVRRTASGLEAVCGAGKIVIMVLGRFDPDDPRACRECAAPVEP